MSGSMIRSLFDTVRQGMEDNRYNFSIDGECSGCGNCCSNVLPMSQKEIDKIRRYVKKHKIKESKHIVPAAEPSYDMTCPFRDDGRKMCTVYPVRPEICRQFICDNEKRAKHHRKLSGQTRRAVYVREEFFGSI